MNRDQDPVIARALADVPVPDHGAGFWEEVDRRIDRAALAEAAGLRPSEAPAAVVPLDVLDLRDAPAAPADRRTSTGELPTVAQLHPPTPTPRRQKVWFAAAAAVFVILAVGVAGYLGDDDEPASTTAASDDTTAPDDSAATTAEPTTATAPRPTVAPDPAPSAATAVSNWLDAVATGDLAAAAALTGPRSVSYIESQGDEATLEGFLTESSEGYGSMADAPDLEVSELPLGTFDFGDLVLVAVAGTFTGEGMDGGYVTFVFPVVIDGDDALVEPWAFGPNGNGRFDVTLPETNADGGNVLDGAQAIELFAPVDGTVFFHLDDGTEGTRPVETSTVAGAPFARYDPPGELASGDHLVTLGFVSPDGEVLVGEAVAFTVP